MIETAAAATAGAATAVRGEAGFTWVVDQGFFGGSQEGAAEVHPHLGWQLRRSWCAQNGVAPDAVSEKLSKLRAVKNGERKGIIHYLQNRVAFRSSGIFLGTVQSASYIF